MNLESLIDCNNRCNASSNIIYMRLVIVIRNKWCYQTYQGIGDNWYTYRRRCVDTLRSPTSRAFQNGFIAEKNFQALLPSLLYLWNHLCCIRGDHFTQFQVSEGKNVYPNVSLLLTFSLFFIVLLSISVFLSLILEIYISYTP